MKKLPGYETVVVTRVDLTEEGLKTLKDKIQSIVTADGGENVYLEDWGKRKFAYPIDNETRGQYTYFVFTGKSGTVAEIERNLRLHDSVLRFLTVNISKEFDKEVFTKELGTGTPMKREERAPETSATA